MPCYDSQAAEENAQNRIDVVKLRERNDLLARVACKFASILEEVMPCDLRSVVTGEGSEEALKWWAEHKRFDANRR